MIKKMFKMMGTLLAILSFIALFFPWIYAYHGNIDMSARGINLVEFSAWGSIVFILPLMLLAIAFSKLSEKVKNVLLLGLFLLGSISFYYATSSGIEYLTEISTKYVRLIGWMAIYMVFMFFSFLSFYLGYNINSHSSLKWKGNKRMNKNRVYMAEKKSLRRYKYMNNSVEGDF